MSQEPPFAERSRKTEHSPIRSFSSSRAPTLLRDDRTRSQQRNSKNNTQNTRSKSESRPNKTEENTNPQKTLDSQRRSKEAQLLPIKQVTLGNRTTRDMDQQKIQQAIVSCIPEFGGKNTPSRTNALVRFLDMADNIHDSLTTAEEKTIFSKLIKFRLVDEAYTRVSSKHIKDYPALRQLLIGMYSQIYTLEELERNFTEIRQSYSETITEYGYRISEALEKYKNGFKAKYGLEKLDEAYEKHLNTSGVQVFKRGLNNVILKEKIATIKASNLDQIIDETEKIETMLQITMDSHTTKLTTNNTTQRTNPQNNQQRQNWNRTILCNYCQKPNHTWDVCRSRIMTQRNTQPLGGTYNSNPQHFQYSNYKPARFPNENNQMSRPFSNKYQTPNNFQLSSQNNFNQYGPTPTQHTNNFSPRPPVTSNIKYQPYNNNGYQSPPQNNFNQYRQPQQRSNYETKYCSHCKTTTGHTFDECRNKFFGNQNYNRNSNNYDKEQQPPYHRNSNNYDKPQKPPDMNDMEHQFRDLRINMINPQQDSNIHANQFQQQQQGNSNGSSQQ